MQRIFEQVFNINASAELSHSFSKLYQFLIVIILCNNKL